LLSHKIKLLSAKITTSGARVHDVFFIVDRDGVYLADEGIQQALTDDITRALDHLSYTSQSSINSLRDHS